MTQIPYRIIHQFTNGSWHVAAQMQVVDAEGNYVRDGATVPMSGTIHPSFQPLVDELNEFAANELHAAIVGERDTLRTQLESLPTLQAERDQLASQVESLTAEIDALRNPPSPQVVTPRQMWRWLIINLGADIVAQIESAIAAIPDPLHRAIAQSDMQRATSISRDDALVIQLATMLGFSNERMDQAFEEASKL